MVIPKLTIAEIQVKIDLFSLRQKTLEEIVEDMDDVAARNALIVQINSYKRSLSQLHEELVKRNA